jgi:hypothetical protein
LIAQECACAKTCPVAKDTSRDSSDSIDLRNGHSQPAGQEGNQQSGKQRAKCRCTPSDDWSAIHEGSDETTLEAQRDERKFDAHPGKGNKEGTEPQLAREGRAYPSVQRGHPNDK